MTPTGEKQFGIVGASFTGNRGAEAMLTATIDAILERYPSAEIHVLSYFPAADLDWIRKHHRPKVYIHSATPIQLAASWFPHSLRYKVLPFQKKRLYPEHLQGISHLLSLDAVFDVFGVSFMDIRVKFLPFNVLSVQPFLLHGVPVFKLSQALGPITKPLNRMASKWVLPRLALTVSRGRATSELLRDFGQDKFLWIEAPDTSFCLPTESPPPAYPERRGVVVIPSSLMELKHKDYLQTIVEVIKKLREKGETVAILAHSYRTDTDKHRNNDLPLCRRLHAALGSPSEIEILGPGLDARGIKQCVGQFRLALTSRFHGMIAALDTATPVLVLGWSHKYREVLETFSQEDSALPWTNDITAITDACITLLQAGEETSHKIAQALPYIRQEARSQYDKAFAILKEKYGLSTEETEKPGAFIEPDTSSPIGSYRKVWIGYSGDEQIRQGAASGGIVSSVFIHLIETKQIDAALVCHSVFREGQLDHNIYLARSREEILSAQTSKYFDIPILKGLKLIESFEGRVAIVGLPSQINAMSRRAAKNDALRDKIVFKIAIFCGHNSKDDLVRRVWAKKGIDEKNIDSFYFRRGLWRGRMQVRMKDGSSQDFPFQDFSHYQNLHILSLERCLNCFDHMGYYADLSTGDVWMKRFKGSPIKPSIFLARTEKAESLIAEMLHSGRLIAEESDRPTLYRSQLRSINYHYAVSARSRLAGHFGLNLKDRTGERVRWRDQLAAWIVLQNHRISKDPKALNRFMRLPKIVVWAYLCLFKGLTHHKRKTY